MKRKTRHTIDGVLMILGAVLAPFGVWAVDGAQYETGPILSTMVAAILSGLATVRAWLAESPRTVKHDTLQIPGASNR